MQERCSIWILPDSSVCTSSSKRQIRDIISSNLSFFAYASPMKTLMENICAILIIIILLPYVFTVLFQGNQLESGQLQQESAAVAKQDRQERWILRSVDDTEERLSIEEYVIGVVAAGMPVAYEKETLKAQAVIARTHIMLNMGEKDAVNEEELNQKYMSVGDMQAAWGYQTFTENYKKLEEAVKATEGQVILYQDKLIYPPFHAVSAGRTKNGNEIAGKQIYPYLLSVDSGMDLQSEDYLKILYCERSSFVQKLRLYGEEITFTNENVTEEIEIRCDEDSDYVKSVYFKNGQYTMTGEQFRDLFELNSTCFSIEDYEGNIRIVTKGLGHGIGFSEYGANQMAKQGSTYETLLSHYYSGTKIGNIYE